MKPPRLFLVALLVLLHATANADDRPNILWIVSEDNGPYLGCYGDPVARTPHLDALAAESVRFTDCVSNAAVCAPARQTLISGMYATSIGGQPMRFHARFPGGVPFFPKWLREHGYYTSNNAKTDYNGGPADTKAAMEAAWDESSGNAHWRNRQPGRPFFSVFNLGDSHESNLFPDRWKNRKLKTDPDTVTLPGYLPDLPEIRRDMARYYDCLEAMDRRAGEILAELERDGLAENTVVFYFSDHGGSLPRGKSFAYESGIRVPLLIRFPKAFRKWAPEPAGETSGRLVSFVDFAPTVLSLAGINAPPYMQGAAFLGGKSRRPREFQHVFRGRRGERYDLVRGVRTSDHLYLRNYSPHLPVLQKNSYSFAIDSYGAWKAAAESGGLPDHQARWFEPFKPAEELYHLPSDPDNLVNLVDNPAHAAAADRLRHENEAHLLRVRDSVFFYEGLSGRDWKAFQSDVSYPLDRLIELANRVSGFRDADFNHFTPALGDANACVRFWGVMGCLVLADHRGEIPPDASALLDKRLDDPEAVVQIHAARALLAAGDSPRALDTLRRHGSADEETIQLHALLAIDELKLWERDPAIADLVRKAKEDATPYARRVAAMIDL